MKKTRKEERPKKQAKKDLDPMELCRAMAGLPGGGCGGFSCECSGSQSLVGCAC